MLGNLRCMSPGAEETGAGPQAAHAIRSSQQRVRQHTASFRHSLAMRKSQLDWTVCLATGSGVDSACRPLDLSWRYDEEVADRHWPAGHVLSRTYLCNFIKHRRSLRECSRLGRFVVGFWKSITIPPLSPAPCLAFLPQPGPAAPAPSASWAPRRVQVADLPCVAMHRHRQPGLPLEAESQGPL